MAYDKNKWDSISIDIETLGNKPGGIVASIGLSAFSTSGGPLGPELALYPSLAQQESRGLRVDVSTFLWWLRQSPEAQREVTRDEEERDAVQTVHNEMYRFVDHHLDYGGLVWVKGPSFDFPLLRHLFEAFSLEQPWDFRAERDVRTVRQLFPDFDLPRSPEDHAHTALGDARHQARYVQGALVAFERVKEASAAWPATDQPQMS